MALIDALSFTQNSSDIDLGVVTDTSDYTYNGNPARSEKANYLLWSKTDADSNRTFDNPDQGNVLSTLTYTVNTLKDGYYEAILLRISQYDVSQPYVEQQSSGSVITQYASIIYFPAENKVYKAIAPSTGQSPLDPAFFIEVTDLSTIIDNTNVDVFIQNIYVKTRTNRCTNAKFKDSCGCGCNGDLSKMAPALALRYKIIAADAAFSSGSPEKMEEIIREAEEICSNC